MTAYAKAARALDAWMTEKQVEGDFTAYDTPPRPAPPGTSG